MGRGSGGRLAAVGGVSEGGRGIGMVGAGEELRVCEGLRLEGDLLGGVGRASAVVRAMAIVLCTSLSILGRRRSCKDDPPLLCYE